MLGRDNSSHNHPVGLLVWTHPRGTHGLGPTNLRVMSVDLHTHLMRFTISQNHMVLGGLPIKYYIKKEMEVKDGEGFGGRKNPLFG